MAKLTSRKCPNCGAPIQLQSGVSDVACKYCGNVIHVEWGKKEPPQQQKPPLTVYVKAPSFSWLPAFLLVLVVGPAVIGSAALGLAPDIKSLASQVANEAGIPLGQVSFPVDCGVGQEVSIVGQKFEGTGTLITGDVNCKIKIKNSTLKGDLVVAAKNLVEVTIENSTLEGKEAAVRLGMNSKLFTRKNSILRGEEAGILAGVNSELSLEQTAVEGAEHGVRGEVNLKLRGTQSRIAGKEYGVRAGSNLLVEGRDLTLIGSRAALETEVNLKLDLRGGVFEGGENAVHTKGPNAEVKLSKQARLTARETALDTQSNLELDMEDATIDGGEVGVEAGVNPKLALGPKARVRGGQVALKAGVNLELDMRAATLESEAVAVCAPFNIELQARESVIRGGSDAFRFQRKPQQLDLTSSTVSGSQLFNVQGCAPSRRR